MTAPDLQAKESLFDNVVDRVSGMGNGLIPVQALQRDHAIASTSRSFTVTREQGGRIEIDRAGLRIDVPPGAISTNSLVITVTVLPGRIITYDFQPHGTKFLKPLVFRQNLEGTSWDHLAFKGMISGGYCKSVGQVDLQPGSALLDELFPVEIRTDEARYHINHFSGYIVSSGRGDC